jgi:uncharacterized membrane protein YqaE (UPF0057 family)
MQSQAKKQAIVWGSLLIVFGLVSLAATVTTLGAWTWVAILALAGLGVFGVYLTDRSEWALLVPTYVLWVVALLVALTTLNALGDDFTATYVLVAIALPFLVVFLRNRAQWWALIPAYVLMAVGLMVGLIEVGILNDPIVPAYVMFAIAIPFIVVFARDSRQWWALIPGGIMAAIGLSLLVAEAAVEYAGPVVLVLVGAWILVRQFTRREPTAPEAPTPAAAADELPAE